MSRFDIKNAVLRKDMLIDMRKPKMLFLILAVNIILYAALLVYFGLIFFIPNIMGNSEIGYRGIITFFCFMLWIEEISIVFLTPALTAGSISLEKERQTLEVLLTTQMTTKEIVFGKYLSTVAQIVLLIFSTLPALSVLYIFSNISIFHFFTSIIVLITTVMYIAAFGVFFSALVKNTIISVILSYISVGFLLVISFMGTFMGMAFMNLANELLDLKYSNLLNGDFFIICLYFNPLATLYDILGRVFGYISWDSGGVVRGIQDLDIFVHFTNKNILLMYFPYISIVLQLGCAALLLLAASFFLKPIKRNKR